MYRLSFPLASLFVIGCSHHDPNDSVWESECQSLSDIKIQACYGPGWDPQQAHDRSHYTFYEVDVEKPQADGAFRILFTKKFAIADVDPKLLSQGHADVVHYDEVNKTVTFSVGREPVSFKLD